MVVPTNNEQLNHVDDHKQTCLVSYVWSPPFPSKIGSLSLLGQSFDQSFNINIKSIQF